MPFSLQHAFETRNQCALTVTVRSPVGALPRLTVEAIGIVDTGSEVTLLRPDLARALRLDITGSMEIAHPAHPDPVECLTTFAEIMMHGEKRRIWVIPQPLLVAPGYMRPGLILGMDCFREGKLTIHFPERWWRFTVPPDGA